MVPCQGWLGEAGALWALAIDGASNTVSIETELMRDNFIPDAPYPERISYRCMPETTVVHIWKEIQSEQPDDSIPVPQRSAADGKREFFFRPLLGRKGDCRSLHAVSLCIRARL
jgi:hypothetical protein